MLTSIAALAEPIRVVLADAYGDGVVWFALKGACGCAARVCIDGRKLSRSRNRLFDGAKHPNDPAAILMELGGDEEAVVVPLISRWLDSASSRTVGLNEYGWELIRDALLRLGEPSTLPTSNESFNPSSGSGSF